jgi:FkbM family methyltransferase
VTLLGRRATSLVRYASMGLRLGRVAADRRSRALLGLLGFTALVKQRSRWCNVGVAVRVRMMDRVYPIQLAGRVDLEVLHEIAVEDEYGVADAIDATVIVDLGAHIGLATLRLLAHRPNARVIAVEADPVLLPRLRANVRGLPVTVVHAAVCAQSGERTFYRSDASSWGNSLVRAEPGQEARTVPACTLSELLDEHDIAVADLVKLDIEGAEWDVLRHGVPARVRALVGELHAHDGRTPDELVATLERSMTVTVIRGDAKRMVFVARR